jgi:hypothetical protein
MLLSEMLFARLPDITSITEYRLDASDGGTKLTFRIARPNGPLFWNTLLILLTPLFYWSGKQSLAAFKDAIENDYQAHTEAVKVGVDISGKQIREAASASLRAPSDS